MPVAPLGTVKYIVKPGNTLYSIAHSYNTTIANILKFNPITNPGMIRVGQVLVIPLSPPEAIIYTVKPGDTLYHISVTFGTTVNNLIRFNYLSAPYTIFPGQQLVVPASLR